MPSERDNTAWPASSAGALAIVGAGLMLAGAGLWASTGTNIDRALVDDDMAAYLTAASAARSTLIANLCTWMVGALVLGAAGTAMAGVNGPPGPLSHLARYAYWLGAALAPSAFTAWLALVVQAPANPGATDVAIAKIVGWYAYRADGIATALLIGIGPGLLSLAARAAWAPGWLVVWGYAAAATTVTSFLPYFVPAVPLDVTMLIVPVGIGWTIAAGVVLLRQRA